MSEKSFKYWKDKLTTLQEERQNPEVETALEHIEKLSAEWIKRKERFPKPRWRDLVDGNSIPPRVDHSWIPMAKASPSCIKRIPRTRTRAMIMNWEQPTVCGKCLKMTRWGRGNLETAECGQSGGGMPGAGEIAQVRGDPQALFLEGRDHRESDV